MKAQELKNSILKHAMEGKLTPQNTSDEPVSVLYKRIKDEKKRLIDDKVIKKEKASVPLKAEEIPFEIPKSWEWVRLGEIGRWGAGSTPSRSNPLYYNGDIPWLKTGELNDGVIHQSNEYITELAFKETSVKLNPIGSVLIAMYGATIGKLGILSFEATTNQACCACVPYEGVYNKFLFYYLMSERNTFINAAEGGAQPNISRTKIINLPFPLPPLKEQQRIVENIEKLLQKVDQYDLLEQKLSELNDSFPAKMEKSILQYAVEGKLLPQNTNDEPANVLLKRIKEQKERLIKDKIIRREKSLPPISKDETPFEVPTSWEWVRLKEIYYNLGNKKPDSKFYYIDVASIDNKKGSISESINIINPEEAPSRARKIVRKGTVLYSTIRPYLQNISIVDKDFDLDAIASTAFLVMEPIEISKKYLYYVLKSPFFNTYVKNKMFGVAYPAINDKNLNSAIIPIPPLEEQQRIVEKIEHLLQYIKRIDSTFI